MARNYAAEYAARVARAERVGLSRAQARGHARASEPAVKELRAAAKASGRSLEAEVATRRAGARAKSSRALRVSVGTILDTRSQRDARRFVKDAARDGRKLVVIGTRRNGKGVPLWGARPGAPPIDAATLADLIDAFGGSPFDVIDAEGDRVGYGGGGVPVVAIHLVALS